MNTNFEKIRSLIDDSNLSLPDQVHSIELFSRADDLQLEPVVELFSSDSSWIEKINSNYKAKEASLRVRDSKVWREILDIEEKELEGTKD